MHVVKAIQVYEGAGPIADDPYLFEFENDMYGPVAHHHGGICFNLMYSRCSSHRGGLPLHKTGPMFRRLQKLCLKRVSLTLMMFSRYGTTTFHGLSLIDIGDYHYGEYGGSYRTLGFKYLD